MINRAAATSRGPTLHYGAMSGDQEQAPILGSWMRVYALVLALLIVWIVLFAAFTASYRSFS